MTTYLLVFAWENISQIVGVHVSNLLAARLHIEYPMLFRIENRSSGQATHTGVLEFIADEGMMYMPYWVRLQLHIYQRIFGENGLANIAIDLANHAFLPDFSAAYFSCLSYPLLCHSCVFCISPSNASLKGCEELGCN